MKSQKLSTRVRLTVAVCALIAIAATLIVASNIIDDLERTQITAQIAQNETAETQSVSQYQQSELERLQQELDAESKARLKAEQDANAALSEIARLRPKPRKKQKTVTEPEATPNTDSGFQPGFLGVTVQGIDKQLAADLGLANAMGVIVHRVKPDGPAYNAGIKAGDVIKSIGRTKIRNAEHAINAFALTPAHSNARIVVFRNDRDHLIEVKLGKLSSSGTKLTKIFGILVDANRMNIIFHTTMEHDSGLLIEDVDENSIAFSKGIRAGDAIIEIGQEPINRLEDIYIQYHNALSNNRKSILLLIATKDGLRFVPIELK